MMNQQTAPILIPLQLDEFFEQIKKLIHSEVSKLQQAAPPSIEYSVPGMTYKPLYKMSEICIMFSVSRPTIYSWIKDEKLRPYKIKSRVYFLWEDVRKLIEGVWFLVTNVKTVWRCIWYLCPHIGLPLVVHFEIPTQQWSFISARSYEIASYYSLV